MKQLRTTVLAFFIFATCLMGFSYAQVPGTIDPSFANNGVLILQPNTIVTDVANGMEVVSIDNVLLAGSTETGFLLSDAAIYRILPDGALDATFGTGGVSIFDCGGNQDYVQAMKVLPNGKIVIAGGVYDGAEDVNFFAAQLTANGTLDPSFGTNGITIIPNPAGFGEDIANAIAIQPDGKIILAGSWAVPGFTDDHTTLVRLNINGTLDNSFGTNGIANVTNSGYTNDVAFDVLLLSDGSIITTGYADILDQRIIAEKFTSSGTLDPNFGTNGIAIYNLTTGYDVAWAIKQHPNGKIMIGGKIGIGGPATADYLLMAITANGALDTNFGVGGIASKNVKAVDAALDFIVEPSGKIVLAGSSGTGGLGTNDYTICRFNENGTVDSSFGTNGATISEIASFFSEAGVIGRQSNGKLVVGGRAATVKNDFALVRYFSDPVVADCAVPLNPVTSAISATGATLSWSNPGNAGSFQVRYRSTNDETWNKVYVNTTSVTLTGLTPALKYAWNVKAKCDDGVSSFTNVVKFKTLPLRLTDAADATNSILLLYPNPSTGDFQLNFTTGENVNATGILQIINIFGQVVDSRTISVADGNVQETFQFNGQLPSGNYFIRLSLNDKLFTESLLIQP
ncbi:MAG TPA: T9SS type A sorting domain-containing protein [Chitinophagales bacterium]|nr:T9SS type A sorting domain-containing protein [Chitinophagales bacterium]